MQEQVKKIAFLTLGCKVNFYETEKMMAQFQKLGFEIVKFSEKADVYIVNTCTVTNIADRKSRQMLHRAKKKNPNSLVVAVGCYVESALEKIGEDDAVDAFFTNADKEHMAERFVEQFSLVVSEEANHKEMVYTERTRAFIKVQNGCNQFCSYCLIPFVRGRGVLSSTPKEDVVAEVSQLAKRGYKEVVLTGIHLSSYGVDWSQTNNFVKLEGKPLLSLLHQVAKVEGIERIRLGSLEPRIITPSFLEELSTISKFCPHFHLSLQSGCDTVLKRMNRHYTTKEYRKKVEQIRHYFEKPAITTDVIVGFPGETKEEFEMTRRYLEQLEMADIHVFPYSKRTGTRAADMPEQIAGNVKKERADCLLADTKRYRENYGKLFDNTKQRILLEEEVEREGRRYFVGYNERYVKIGVLAEEAKANNWKPNDIIETMVQYRLD